MIVGVSLLTNVAATPLNPLAFSFFVGPIHDSTGWATSAIALAFSLRLFAAALSTPFIGTLIDRHGARWIAPAGGVAVFAALLLLAFLPTLPMLYIAFIVAGAFGLGVPGGALIAQVPPAKWFVARRGRALAIATVGLPAGAATMVPIIAVLLDHMSWERAYAVLGAGILVAIVPANVLFMRRTPEDHGLLPDGASPGEPADPRTPRSSDPPRDEVSWSVGEAARTRVFWIALLAFVCSGFALSGTVVHRVSYWEETGLPSAFLTIGFASDPLTVVVASLGWGWAAERIPSRFLGAASGTAFALSMLPMILTSGQAYTIFIYALLWGTGAGAWITLNNVLWPEYFGRAALGAIRGAVQPAALAASAFGPVVYGLLIDVGLDPRILWGVSFAVFTTAALLLFTTRAPTRERPPEVLAPR